MIRIDQILPDLLHMHATPVSPTPDAIVVNSLTEGDDGIRTTQLQSRAGGSTGPGCTVQNQPRL
jgi:hypothetical protein